MCVYILYYVCAFLFWNDPSTQRKKSWKQICPTLGHIPKIIQIAFELVNWIIGSCFFCWGNLRKPWHFGMFSRVQSLEAPYEMLRNTTSAAVQKEPSAIRGDTSPQKPGFSGVDFAQKLHFYKAQLWLAHEWLTVDFSWCFIMAMVITDCFHAWTPMGKTNGWKTLWLFTVFSAPSKFTKSRWHGRPPIVQQILKNTHWYPCGLLWKKKRGGKNTKTSMIHDISQSLHDVPILFFRLWSLQIETQHLKQPLGQDLKFALPL